jgi:hypothetical protein
LLLMMMLISCERKHCFFRWKVLLKNMADIFFFKLMEHISPIYSVTLFSQSPILDFRRNGKRI